MLDIPEDILRRAFRCSIGGSHGTCFTVDYNNRQYIVTAQHLAREVRGSATILIQQEQRLKRCSVNLVGHCKGNVDISVLAAETQLSPQHRVSFGPSGLMLGQDVYILGYPHGIGSEAGELNHHFPIPFVKKAVMSAINHEPSVYLLDSYLTGGFSGSPVVRLPREMQDEDCSIFAVVAERLDEEHPVSHAKQNAGIAVCYDIRYAIDLIDQNPIGFNLRD